MLELFINYLEETAEERKELSIVIDNPIGKIITTAKFNEIYFDGKDIELVGNPAIIIRDIESFVINKEDEDYFDCLYIVEKEGYRYEFQIYEEN